MKNLLKLFSLWVLISLFAWFSFASSSDCIERDLWNNSICVSIDKWSSNRYTLHSQIDCNWSCPVSCSILLPDNTLEQVWTCNGSFYYDSNSTEKVKLYMNVWNEFGTIEAYYNFRNGYRWNEEPSGSSSDYLDISSTNTSPSAWSYVKLTINTDSDYQWRISFYKVEYKAPSSSYRTTISSRTNSTYFYDYSDEREDGYYNMTRSDHGRKTINNFLKFKKTGYYKITAKDKNWETDSITFNVWWNSSSTDSDLDISAASTSITPSQYVKLYIDTDEDYQWKINFSLKYKANSSNNWSTISNLTNSTYVSDYSDEWDDGYYRMVRSDYGRKTLSNLVKFKKTGYYQITAEDTNWNEDSVEIHVTSSSSYNDNELELSSTNTSTNVWSYVRLTINTDEDYVWKITFTEVEYKSSSSANWSTISSRTSSTYFSDYSDEWEDGYYRMTRNDNGEKTISNFLKFKKAGYYRIYAEDIYWNEDYIVFNVWGWSSSSDYVQVETDDDTPEVWEYVDITVLTDRSYRWEIIFYAKYRSSTNNTWSQINRTSSTYFTNRSSAWTNWYITMTSSDRGERTVSNIFKFAKKGYYRIYAEDEDGNYNYVEFNVWNSQSSPLDWYTQNEYDSVVQIYNVWPSLITNLKNKYPILRNSTTRQNRSDTLYDNMRDVKNKKSNREFLYYEDFERALTNWLTYTQNLID